MVFEHLRPAPLAALWPSLTSKPLRALGWPFRLRQALPAALRTFFCGLEIAAGGGTPFGDMTKRNFA